MLTIPWNSNTGWGTPEIKPCMYSSIQTDRRTPFLAAGKMIADGWVDAPLQLDPSATVLHYAFTL